MLRNKTFAPEFCSLISNWSDMREQAPGSNVLHDSVSGARALVCTEICFAGACFRRKLPRVYWLGYLPGSVFQEQAPSCVLKFALRERVSGASSLVCTGWGTYQGACFRSVFRERVSGAGSIGTAHTANDDKGKENTAGRSLECCKGRFVSKMAIIMHGK